MDGRRLGATGFEVSVLGLGTGRLGGATSDDATAGRLRNLAIDLGVSLIDAALWFAAFAPGVASALVGSADERHLRSDLATVANGPLPEDTEEMLREAVEAPSARWLGIV